MNDLMLLLIILSSVTIGMFGGHFISVLSFKYTHEKKEVDTSDPKLKDEEVDCQIMVNVYKSGKVNMTPYTKNQEPLPDCVREEALHKAMLKLGYTQPSGFGKDAGTWYYYTPDYQAVCTKSTTLEPVAVDLKNGYDKKTGFIYEKGKVVASDMLYRTGAVEVEPEPVEEGLDAVYPMTANEAVEKLRGGKNAKASESKAD
jgi:hypothetical protein